MTNQLILFLTLVIYATVPSFGQPLKDTVVDIDGNVYHTIKIGTQIWMVENLKVKHYCNGVALDYQQKVENIFNGDTSKIGAYSVYNNDTNNIKKCGLLYNWYSLNDNQKLCPNGWHVPTEIEWQKLELFLGMKRKEVNLYGPRGVNEGGKLKDTIDAFWEKPNVGATNIVGFKALACGCRDGGGGDYQGFGISSNFWSSSENDIHNLDGTFVRSLNNDNSQIGRTNYSKSFGFSVRCIKN